MKALTIHQPYPNAMMQGLKLYETRGWYTHYRGPLAIHASMSRVNLPKNMKPEHALSIPYVPDARDMASDHTFHFDELRIKGPFPLGAIVAVGRLVDCKMMTPELIGAQCHKELALGDWRFGRWAWDIIDLCPLLLPLPIKGQQGLWNVPAGLLPDWE